MRLHLLGGLAALFDWNRPVRALASSLVLILLLAGLPVLGVLIATGAAGALGCTLDEGDVHPCPFLGIDLGSALYDLFVLGWFGLLTLPAGALLLLAWLSAAVVFAIKRMAGRK